MNQILKEKVFLFMTLLLGLGAMIQSGCAMRTEAVDEVDEKAYQRGLSLLRQGRDTESLASFLKVIQARRLAPKSHMEAGKLYLKVLKDPITAIYHFKQFISITPEGHEARIVKQLIETSEKEFLKKLPGKPYAGNIAAAEAKRELEILRKKNNRLEVELGDARGKLTEMQNSYKSLLSRSNEFRTLTQSTPREPVTQVRRSAVSDDVPAVAVTPVVKPIVKVQETVPVASNPRKYTVVSGDTLTRISRKVYGTPSKWTLIYNSNRHILQGPNALKVGQVLNIP